eukprot:1671155-Rhodomonas_salina.1
MEPSNLRYSPIWRSHRRFASRQAVGRRGHTNSSSISPSPPPSSLPVAEWNDACRIALLGRPLNDSWPARADLNDDFWPARADLKDSSRAAPGLCGPVRDLNDC